LTVQENLHPKARLFVGSAGKETVSAYVFDDSSLRLVYRFAHPSGPVSAPTVGILNIRLLQSIGHLWRWASWYCCGGGNDAGKVMGLAAHGDMAVHAGLDFARFESDGLLSIDFDLLSREFQEPNLAGVEISGNRHYADLAAAVQDRTNRLLVELLTQLKEQFPAQSLYYSGGVALNVVANEVITRSGLFETVHMNGSCEDNGTAAGAAMAAHVQLGGERQYESVTDYYGRSYPDSDIETALTAHRCSYRRVADDEIAAEAAQLLADGAVIGWFQGGSEFGPRALGNRSILANPTDPHTKYVLDLIVKRRERYRPYAPAVLAERCHEFFDIDGPSPVMLREGRVFNPAKLPAITHVDNSARVQTVRRGENPRYYDLIKCFGEKTGVPVILNTSYNLAGDPIVETPEDAVRSFTKSGLRNLVIGNYVAERPTTA
jgi:carbamoyltransferase